MQKADESLAKAAASKRGLRGRAGLKAREASRTQWAERGLDQFGQITEMMGLPGISDWGFGADLGGLWDSQGYASKYGDHPEPLRPNWERIQVGGQLQYSIVCVLHRCSQVLPNVLNVCSQMCSMFALQIERF